MVRDGMGRSVIQATHRIHNILFLAGRMVAPVIDVDIKLCSYDSVLRFTLHTVSTPVRISKKTKGLIILVPVKLHVPGLGCTSYHSLPHRGALRFAGSYV